MYDESWELIPKRVDREEVLNRDLLRSTLGTKFELGGTIKSHLDRSDKILPVEGWPNRLFAGPNPEREGYYNKFRIRGNFGSQLDI